MQQDNFEDAYQQVYSAFVKLCGGYYEPKSERDRLASEALHDLLRKLDRIKDVL